jgi:phosphoglycolate phosphatase-like HAD superfamily hydrolase
LSPDLYTWIDLFDGGIFDSPNTKEVIFERELKEGNIKTPALFLGDSKYDYLASQKVNGIDFIFLSNWTEVSDWESWSRDNKIVSEESLSSLLK